MELLQPRQTESHENETTHAVDSVSILVHEGGPRIFVNDCPLEFFESKGTCGVAAARPLNSLLDMHVVAAGVFQVKAASGPVLNQQFSGHGVSGSSMSDEQTTHHYAAVYRQLRKQGTPIPINDMWIAALVLQHSLPVCPRHPF